MTSSGSDVSAKAVKPPEVAEDDHDLPPMALQERLVAGVDHEVRELRREEPPQPVDPLELGDLRLDPLLQLAVPGRELALLPLDRVVVALDPDQRIGLEPAARTGRTAW